MPSLMAEKEEIMDLAEMTSALNVAGQAIGK